MSEIQVSESQSKIKIDHLHLEKAAEAILNALDYTDAELSIVIVDDDEMASLNRQYRQKDSTTDVLAFSMTEGEFSDIEPEMLGDVVISAPTADLIRRRNNVPLAAVMDLLLVHGILHLVGYDHEQGVEQARLMETKTMQIMNLLGHQQTDLNWFLDNAQDLN